MAIYRLLQRSAFDPDEVKRMVEAYELALALLELKDRDDRLTQTIAKYIVDGAQTGEKDPRRICEFALNWLRDSDRQAS